MTYDEEIICSAGGAHAVRRSATHDGAGRYNGHLKHGHTWKLKSKVYGKFVLTREPKHETE